MFGVETSTAAKVVAFPRRPVLLEVRRYRSEDAVETLTVFREAVRRGAARDYTPAQRSVWAPELMDATAWAERRGSRATWVVERRGSVVGFSDLKPDAEVDMLYVHPDHEGLGIATSLLEEVEYTARELGMPKLYANVSLTASNVFTRCGFHPVRCQIVDRDGITLPNTRMEKRLGRDRSGGRL